MTLAAFLKQVVEILDEAAIQYMLKGSLAAAYYAVPRATQDIDIVLESFGRVMNRPLSQRYSGTPSEPEALKALVCKSLKVYRRIRGG